jgi:hypothetical protein
MNEQLFRKKSIERISSPEQLNDYIRVANPSIWLVLGAVVILLVGVIVWGVIGHLDTTLPVAMVAEGGEAVLYVKEADAASVEPGMTVRAEGGEYAVTAIASQPVKADGLLSEYAMHAGGLVSGEWVYAVQVSGSFADGVYRAEIVTDRVSPISFILN